MNSVMDIKLKYANMLSTAATIIITPDATFFFFDDDAADQTQCGGNERKDTKNDE